MISFATIEDLNARRMEPLTGRAGEVAQTLLGDASAMIAAELVSSGIDYGRRMRDDSYARLLTKVTCAAVDRAIGVGMPGVKSRQQSAGPYSFTDSFENPRGDLYLLASERRDLGIGRTRYRPVRPAIRPTAREVRHAI